MRPPALVAAAHGGRQAATQRCVRSLAERVRRAAPPVEVRVAFVQHGTPSLPQVLAESGPGTVVVPLLLGSGYHLSADVGGAAAAAGARVAPPLGPDAGLADTLAGRLTAAGAPPGCPVVLAAAGSRDPRAGAQAREQAGLLACRWGGPVRTAFASACRPRVGEAVAALGARTGRPVAVAAYLLAPGQFYDVLRASGASWVSEPLGDHPAVARVVLERYRAGRG